MSDFPREIFPSPQSDVDDLVGIDKHIMDTLAQLEALRHEERELEVNEGELVYEENVWTAKQIEVAFNNIRTGDLGEYIRAHNVGLLKKLSDCTYLAQRISSLLQDDVILSRFENGLKLYNSIRYFRASLMLAANSFLENGQWVKGIFVDETKAKEALVHVFPNADEEVLYQENFSNNQWRQLVNEGLASFQELDQVFQQNLNRLEASADELLHIIHESLSSLA